MELRLKEYYICYIDILGYSNMIKRYGAEVFLNVIDSTFTQVLSVLKDTIGYDDIPYKIKIFSDNLIICIESKYDEASSVILGAIALIQQEFIEKNIFIRGAITKGDLYISDNYIFGDGLLRAYELENNIAVYPRIIIDNDYQDEILEWRAYICDTDGYYFVDYLFSYFGGAYSEKSPMPEKRQKELIRILSIHKHNITNALRENTNERIKQKYQWCKNYHNLTCREYGLTRLIID